jgi:glycosyltransferase involved in cell wall biosynthesis
VRVVYYTHTAFFEVALSLVEELSKLAEVHLLMEVGPAAWATAGFDRRRETTPEGLVPGRAILEGMPPGVGARVSGAASFQLVVHGSSRSLDPRAWRISRQALGFTRDLEPDVLHVDDVDVSPRLPMALGAARGIPLILSVHDPETHSGEASWRKRLSRRLAYPKANRFLLHSRVFERDFAEAYRIPSDRICTVHLGALDVLRAWGEDGPIEDRPTVLFFGRLSVYKGLETLYVAAPLVAEQVPDVRIVVAGRPVREYVPPSPPHLPEPAILEVLDGYVSNPRAARLFREATVVACPYKDATQSAVLLTAYGFERPVVATRVGGIPEYVKEGETGLLVPPDDPRRLADALVRVLRDDELRTRLQDGIRRARGDRLDWGRAAREVLQVYEAAADISRRT